MCGIAGIISDTNLDSIHRMTDALIHRGPDGEGYFKGTSVALGHRRLSIIDLEGGAQPISNEDDRLQLVCNGEIYNSPELRKSLISSGHKFKTSTDVEVILHLYEEYGADCVEHLRGMFAFAIWDTERRELFMARDHMGQKPLFFCDTGESFLFASEIKAILASGLLEPEINLEALWHYISLRYIPDQMTLFRGISKMPAAMSGTWRKGSFECRKYWDPQFKEKFVDRETVIVDGLDELMQETVNMHTLSDVSVGTFLSGGIDSSTVAAMMAKQSRSPIRSFSIGVKEQDFNELPYAKMVAERYDMIARERVVKADLIHLIPSMILHMDEPSDPFGVGVYLVSQLAAEDVKVVLSGDGGDENFAGYDRFFGQKIADYYAVLPRWFRKKFMTAIIDRIPESFGYKSLAQKTTWLNEMSFFNRGDRYAHSMSFLRFTAEAKESLFTELARSKIPQKDSAQKILDHFDASNATELVDRMLYTDLMTRMPDHLLTLSDRMSMAHSLESRPVLVDHKIVEYAARIPSSLKLKRGQLKYILKKVAARYLPTELLRRRKQGFAFPIGSWMREELREFMLRLFEESRFIQLGIFERDYVYQMLDEHISGKTDHNYRLWILINLEFWYRIYFEGATIDSLREYTDELLAA